MVQQGRLDLAQLDAETAQLDLLVAPADKLQLAVLPQARQVAGLVQARPRPPAKRIGQEALGGQVRTVQIAACQPGPTQVKLARLAGQHRLQARIQQIGLQPIDGPADRDTGQLFRSRRAQIEPGGIGGRFGGAVQVQQDTVGEGGLETAPQIDRQGFTAAHPQAQVGQAGPVHRQAV